jgi:hypothetical protein
MSGMSYIIGRIKWQCNLNLHLISTQPFKGKTSQILNTGINVRDAITVNGDVRLTVI